MGRSASRRCSPEAPRLDSVAGRDRGGAGGADPALPPCRRRRGSPSLAWRIRSGWCCGPGSPGRSSGCTVGRPADRPGRPARLGAHRPGRARRRRRLAADRPAARRVAAGRGAAARLRRHPRFRRHPGHARARHRAGRGRPVAGRGRAAHRLAAAAPSTPTGGRRSRRSSTAATSSSPRCCCACCGSGTAPLWGRYVRLVLALSAAGLATYVLYPAAPPWLAAKDGVIEPVRRLSATGWDVLGLPHAGALLADSQGQVNQVAAVPSLHTAFAVLTCLVLFPVARRAWQRAALVAYAVLMPLVLVWAGEHYVVDTLLGALYAAGSSSLVRPCGPAAQPGVPTVERVSGAVPDWLTAARRICVLTGAGISTDSGIPDFRGPNGRVDPRPGRREARDALRTTWPTRTSAGGPGRAPRPQAGDGAAQRRPPGAGRAGAAGPAARAGHPEHRRAAPGGRVRARSGSSSCTAPSARSSACPAAPGRRCAARSTGSPPASPTRACLLCGGILKSATIELRAGARPAPCSPPRREAAADCDVFLAVGTSLHGPAGRRADRGRRRRRRAARHRQRRADAVRRPGRPGPARADRQRCQTPRAR